MKRRLIDRYENYDSIIHGQCKCGEPVDKVLGSDVTIYRNKVRFCYPLENSPACIFRCRKCLRLIEETFEEVEKLKKELK